MSTEMNALGLLNADARSTRRLEYKESLADEESRSKQGFQWGGDLLKMAMFMVLLCLERNVTRIGIGSACGVSFRFGFGFTVGTLARELSVDSRLSPGLRRRLSTVISMQGGGKR
jgi:hypothetical protein